MLPPQVIDTVLPIRNYILHGSRIKRAAIEEVVRENEQKMQRILETAADGFLEFDSDGTIKQINQAAEKMMNLSTSALLGEKIFSIFSTRSAREVPLLVFGGECMYRATVLVLPDSHEWGSVSLPCPTDSPANGRVHAESIRKQELFQGTHVSAYR